MQTISVKSRYHIKPQILWKFNMSHSVSGPAQCHSQVELRISCSNLLDKDFLSKSDPLCALYLLDGKKWREVSVLACASLSVWLVSCIYLFLCLMKQHCKH